MTAAEAAERLGVKRATLYAYVSRGLLTSLPGEGREHHYLAADVERLRIRAAARAGHAPVAAGALRFGEPVIESALTAITPDGPAYRGRLATALAAADTTFEAVADWLWDAEDGDGWGARDLGGLPFDAVRAQLGAGSTPLDAVRLALAFADVDGALDGPLAPRVEHDRARALVRRLAAAAGRPRTPRAAGALAHDGVARVLVTALGGEDAARADVVAAVNRALVLTADHELNVSSFTARVVASTGATLTASLQAAAAALSGARHGGVCAQVEQLLDEAAALPDPAQVVKRRHARGETIPGMGHPLYPGGDPRGRALIAWAVALGGDAPGVRAVSRIVDAMAAAGLPAPTLDLGLVAVAEAGRLPRGSAAAIFAVGRSVGWIAHALEQRSASHLLRPRARYVGP
ncbi:MAG: helix-turn-helix domain-containing protein [Deltaproteobacteria bacterium]|nr:helix-turn-helix domain-containing protein [Deltaproteobacteria bacterium]